MVADRIICEDMVQTVFLKFFQNMNIIRDKEKIKPWLFTTARNEVFTYYRRKKIRVDQYGAEDVEEIQPAAEENIAEKIERSETKEILLKELEKFPAEQKEIFMLKEYSGLSYKEIADVLDTNIETVKSRLYKARQKLIKRLSKILKHQES